MRLPFYSLLILDLPDGIALDVGAGRMYWVDNSTPGKILRAKLDGTEVVALIDVGLVGPDDIILDLADDKMYWTDQNASRVQRADLDGYWSMVMSPSDLPVSLLFHKVENAREGQLYTLSGETQRPGAAGRKTLASSSPRAFRAIKGYTPLISLCPT